MLKKKYQSVPILGLTATATIKVKQDIIKQLGMKADGVVCF
jgi:superfamily II DNA helicase RecQ